MPEPKHDGIALDDSYLLTGLSEEQRDFLTDNESAILYAISQLIERENSVITVETQRKEIVLVETNYARTF